MKYSISYHLSHYYKENLQGNVLKLTTLCGVLSCLTSSKCLCIPKFRYILWTLRYIIKNRFKNHITTDCTLWTAYKLSKNKFKKTKPNIYCCFLPILVQLQGQCSIALIAVVDWIPDVNKVYVKYLWYIDTNIVLHGFCHIITRISPKKTHITPSLREWYGSFLRADTGDDMAKTM